MGPMPKPNSARVIAHRFGPFGKIWAPRFIAGVMTEFHWQNQQMERSFLIKLSVFGRNSSLTASLPNHAGCSLEPSEKNTLWNRLRSSIHPHCANRTKQASWQAPGAPSFNGAPLARLYGCSWLEALAMNIRDRIPGELGGCGTSPDHPACAPTFPLFSSFAFPACNCIKMILFSWLLNIYIVIIANGLSTEKVWVIWIRSFVEHLLRTIRPP